MMSVPDPIALWPGDMPGTARGVAPETVDAMGRVENVSRPTLTPWLPEAGRANGLAVIVCPGGGYRHLPVQAHVEALLERLVPEGFAVFGLKYRLDPPSRDVRRDALADAARAVRLVRKKAEEWRVDSRSIGVIGFSAGANVALNLAAGFDAGDPDAEDPVQRWSSRPDYVAALPAWIGGGCDWSTFELRADSPPAFLCHAEDDATAPVELSRDIARQMTRLGVPVELRIFAEGGHRAFEPGGVEWLPLFLEWLSAFEPRIER